MDFADELLDQQPSEERRRQQRMAKMARLPREEVIEVTEGATAYRGVVTSVTVAGEQVIIMAKTGSALMIAHQKITNFAEFKCGLVHKAVIMAARDVEIDDEL